MPAGGSGGSGLAAAEVVLFMVGTVSTSGYWSTTGGAGCCSSSSAELFAFSGPLSVLACGVASSSNLLLRVAPASPILDSVLLVSPSGFSCTADDDVGTGPSRRSTVAALDTLLCGALPVSSVGLAGRLPATSPSRLLLELWVLLDNSDCDAVTAGETSHGLPLPLLPLLCVLLIMV